MAQQQQQPQGPPAPLPAPVQRKITVEDLLEAYKTEERRGYPIPNNISDVPLPIWPGRFMTITCLEGEVGLGRVRCNKPSNILDVEANIVTRMDLTSVVTPVGPKDGIYKTEIFMLAPETRIVLGRGENYTRLEECTK